MYRTAVGDWIDSFLHHYVIAQRPRLELSMMCDMLNCIRRELHHTVVMLCLQHWL